MRTSVVAMAIGGVFLIPAPTHTHHSQSMYDMTKETTVKGVVTKFEWTNPHSWIYVDARDDQGKITQWEFETLSPNNLTRSGWKRTQLKQGDQVTVVGHAQKDGKPRARLARVILADGKVLRPGQNPAIQ